MNAPSRCCAIIPCYNHGATVGRVVRAAAARMPVIVVDDGSTDQTREVLGDAPCVERVRFEANRGKGAALKAGLDAAARLGFTHAVTLDADGQHDPAELDRFTAASVQHPDAILVGVRDLRRAGAPRARRFANRFSNMWFRIETGCALHDTQCGYRCYPVERTRSLRTHSDGYGYELEVLVHAAWVDVPLVAIEVSVSYDAATTGRSHFRPLADFGRISRIHTRLASQSFCLPKPLRAILARGELAGLPWRRRMATVLQHVGSEHTSPPFRLALAIGLGLFCGIAPIWGYQMAAAALLAHALRLNKAIALTASNISFPLAAPFILAGGLWVGHWLLYGAPLAWSIAGIHEKIGAYFVAWVVGSFALALIVAAAGTLVALIAVYSVQALRGLRTGHV